MSTVGLQILAGIIPMDLKINEIIQLRKAKNEKEFLDSRFPNVHPQIQCFINMDQQPTHEGIEIYTDGSKNEEGTGASAVVLENGIPTSIFRTTLSAKNDNYQAEMCGIKMAVEHILKYRLRETIIYTDSFSSI